MSILIEGMEMPKSCPCELLGIGYDLYCSFAAGIPARVKEYYECCQNGMRPSWCPLVPVPPHGRLIDADELKDLVYANIALFDSAPGRMGADQKIVRAWLSSIAEDIDDAPTIIPAEEGE